jgi:uncharacterized membrane protein
MAKKFLTQEEEDKILKAIENAEKETSGEIRVHIESKCKLDAVERAVEIFYALKMEQTSEKNGVLIYVAYKDRKLAILGDSGINAVVPDGFWDNARDLLVSHFKENKIADGLVGAIELSGKQLKAYFPFQSNDRNELSNDISFGH